MNVKTKWMPILLCSFLFLELGNATDSNSVLKKLQSSDVNERMKGFYDTSYIPYREKNACAFKISDTISAKKAVIELLLRERKYEQDNLVNGIYGPKLGEAFLGYIGDIELVVDSCEDEAAISLFPGPKTENKYPQQTFEALVSKAEKVGLGSYSMAVMARLGVRFKSTNKETYERAKKKLIEYVGDERRSEVALRDLEILEDPDLIPVFERISKYDNSKGQAEYDLHGKKIKIKPISGIAREALRKLKEKYKNVQSSTTKQIN